MTQARDRRSDRGTATIWVLAVCVLLLMVAGVAAARAAAVLARHRAESAADVAALAAAGRLGTGQAPCLAAEAVARRNSATVDSCRVRADAAGRTGVVDVVVSVPVRLPGIGATRVRASARAGRQVAGRGAEGVPRLASGQFGSTGLGGNAVWHAGRGAPMRAFRPRTQGTIASRRVNAWRSRFRGTPPKTCRSYR